MEENEKGFARKPLLARTPPSRSFSNPDLRMLGGIAKRKRANDPESERFVHRKLFDSNCEVSNLSEDTVLKLDKALENVVKLLDPEPSTELKKAIQELRRVVSLFNFSKGERKPEETYPSAGDLAVKKDMVSAETQLSAGELDKEKTLISIGTQLSEGELERFFAADILRNKILAANLQETFKIIEDNWPRSMFERTKVIKRGLDECEGSRAFIAETTSEADWQVLKGLANQFPSIAVLMNNKPQNCSVATIDCSDGISFDDEQPQMKSRKLFVAFVSRANKEEEMTAVLKSLRKKSETCRLSSITLSADSLLDPYRLRKLCECCFIDSKVEIEICAPKKGDKSSETLPSDKQKVSHDTIFIKKTEPNQSYAQVVNGLKGSLNTELLGVTIDRVSETKDGGVKMVIKEMKKGAKESLIAEIKKTSNAEVQSKRKDTPILFCDLDETTTRDEISRAIFDNFGITKESVTIRDIKRSFSGKYTAYATLPPTAALKVLSRTSVKIGWVRSRIREQLIPICCNRCLQFGHKARDCKSPKPNEPSMCKRCAQTGHLAKACENEKRCYVCEEDGHRADSMACPNFREVVRKMHASNRRTSTETVESKLHGEDLESAHNHV